MAPKSRFLQGFQRLVTTKCSRSGRCVKKKTPPFFGAIFAHRRRSVYQDRLWTNTGKTQPKKRFRRRWWTWHTLPQHLRSCTPSRSTRQENASFAPFCLHKNDHFTKTGWGQTRRNAQKTESGVFFFLYSMPTTRSSHPPWRSLSLVRKRLAFKSHLYIRFKSPQRLKAGFYT